MRCRFLWLLLMVIFGLSSCNAQAGNQPPQTGNQSQQATPSIPLNTAPISGQFLWIDDCQFDPLRGQGLASYHQMIAAVKKPVDVGLFEDGWINPTTGTLFTEYSQETARCLQDVITAVHQQHGKVYMVLGIVLKKTGNATGFTTDQIDDYEAQASTTHSEYYQTITAAVVDKGYDGAILDIEDGSKADAFTSYCNGLHAAFQSVSKPLGIALIHKTQQQSDEDNALNGFEDFPSLANTAEFFVIMALDQGHGKVNQPIITKSWLTDIYNYVKNSLPMQKVTWEFDAGCIWWDWAGQLVRNPCTYATSEWMREHLKQIKSAPVLNVDTTLVTFTGLDGKTYTFADPMTVDMYKELYQLSRNDTACIRGSYWVAGIEADRNMNEENTLAGELAALSVFC